MLYTGCQPCVPFRTAETRTGINRRRYRDGHCWPFSTATHPNQVCLRCIWVRIIGISAPSDLFKTASTAAGIETITVDRSKPTTTPTRYVEGVCFLADSYQLWDKIKALKQI